MLLRDLVEDDLSRIRRMAQEPAITRYQSVLSLSSEDEIRRWVEARGFEEIAFDGAPEPYGVGIARMIREPVPYRTGVRFFVFASPEPDERQRHNGIQRQEAQQ